MHNTCNTYLGFQLPSQLLQSCSGSARDRRVQLGGFTFLGRRSRDDQEQQSRAPRGQPVVGGAEEGEETQQLHQGRRVLGGGAGHGAVAHEAEQHPAAWQQR